MIRETYDTDLNTLVESGRTFWAKTPYIKKGMFYHPAVVHTLLETMLDYHYLSVSVDQADVINGFLGIWIAPFMFNTDYIQATELFFFVHPYFRGQGIGTELHKRAEDELKDEVDLFAFGTLNTSTDMEEYYTKNGFEITERIYTKVL